MSDRFNSTIRADTRSGVRRFFDREVLGRVYDVVDNKVLNPFRPDSEIPRAISPLTEFMYGVRADGPMTLDDTAAVALGTFIPGGGKTLKATRTAMGPLARTAKSVAGLFGKSRKVASAEKKFAGLAKSADIVDKTSSAVVKTYENPGAAVLRDGKLKAAVEKSLEDIKKLQPGPLKAKVEPQQALVAGLAEKGHKAAGAAAVTPAGAAKGPLARAAKSVIARFGTPGKITRAEKKLAALTKEADIVEKSLDTAVKTYEKSGAATLRNSKLDTAVRKSFEEIKNRQLGPLKAKVESQEALIARLTEKSRKAAEAAANPAATATAKRLDVIKAANKGLRTSAMDPSDYAKTVMREARKQVTAGEPGRLATFIKDHPKAAVGLKWGAITGVPTAAYAAYATTSESRKDAAAAEAMDAKKAAIDAVVANGWHSVTNSEALAAAYDDIEVTRELMRHAKLVASEQVRLLGNDEDAEKVQQAKAVDTLTKVADILRESDAWAKGLEEFNSKIDKSAELAAEGKLLRLPPGTDWNRVYEDTRRELMNQPDEDKVLGEPYYPLDPQNGGPQ